MGPVMSRLVACAGLLFVSACRPPGYGKHDDPSVDAAATVDAVAADASIDSSAATCTKAFRLDGHSLAPSVALTGTFVSWAGTAPPAIAFTLGGDGAWTGSYAFPAGVHQYKFIVGTNWIPDPTNPDQVDDGFGGKNSVYTCTP